MSRPPSAIALAGGVAGAESARSPTRPPPSVGPGVSASKLGMVKGGGGKTQVTYIGHSRYWFVGDTGPGRPTARA